MSLCNLSHAVRLIFFFNIFLRVNSAPRENISRPEVTIPQGTLRGTILKSHRGRDVLTFLSIPYAQPPVGKLRFANPVPAHGWQGSRDASIDHNMCLQFQDNAAVIGDEDCLYLNVYTSQLRKNSNSSLHPVMVYVHGGAFLRGTANSTKHGPGFILDADVVLVVPGYRLGPLGFLSTGDEVAPGNWGMKDQVLALKWVQANIEYFGGDPERVTLVGQSAGGACVHLLSLSNATNGLFHRYIAQSGSALAPWAHRPRTAYGDLAFRLGTYVGCFNETTVSLINCLREIHFADIITTHPHFLAWQWISSTVWGPTDEPDIEGAVLTDSPVNLFASGSIRGLPSLSGVVRDEGFVETAGFLLDESLFPEFIEKIDYILQHLLSLSYESSAASDWINAIKSQYFDKLLTTNKTALFSNLTLLVSDALFFYPAYNALHQHLIVANNPQYFYTFNYRGNNSHNYYYENSAVKYVVAHGDVLFYLFPNRDMSEADLQVMYTMVHIWTSFAIHGTPSVLHVNGSTTWEPFSQTGHFLQIGNDSDVVIRSQYTFFEEQMQFWRELDAVKRASDPSFQ